MKNNSAKIEHVRSKSTIDTDTDRASIKSVESFVEQKSVKKLNIYALTIPVAKKARKWGIWS